MHPHTSIMSTAAMQGGVIRRSQAIAAGLTDTQISTRISSHQWTKITEGVYRVYDMSGRANLVRAAVATLPGAVASHYSAAAIHGISRVDTRAVSVLVHSRTTHSFPGVLVFRCRDLTKSHIVHFDGLPVTSVARTVVDLASQLRPKHLDAVIDEVLAARQASIDALHGALTSVARRGKPGVQSLRAALSARQGEHGGMSVLERKGLRLLRSAGISGFMVEYPIPWAEDRRFDLAFIDDHLAIEWDSRRWHLQAAAFENDRNRDSTAIAKGWRVLRFTWNDVHTRPDYVVATVREALAD